MDNSFSVVGRNKLFLLVMAVESIVGTFIGGLLLGLVPSASPSRVTVAFGRHDLAAQLAFKTPAPVSVPTEVAWIIANKGSRLSVPTKPDGWRKCRN
jgi:hypothetical protein